MSGCILLSSMLKNQNSFSCVEIHFVPFYLPHLQDGQGLESYVDRSCEKTLKKCIFLGNLVPSQRSNGV